MKDTPWKLFLPHGDGAKTLLLGDKLIVGSNSWTAHGDIPCGGPFSCVVRSPGGPRATLGEFRRIRDNLADNGILIWISRPGEPITTVQRQLTSTFAEWLSYRVDGSTLIQERSWGHPFVRAGKAELILRAIPKVLRRLASHKITIAVLRGGGSAGWCHGLLRTLEARNIAAIHPKHLRALHTMSTGTVVLQIGNSEPEWILKVALNDFARTQLKKQSEVLRSLGRLDIPDDVRDLVPHIEDCTSYNGVDYSMERHFLGDPGYKFMYQRKVRESLVDDAIDWLTRLHVATCWGSYNAKSVPHLVQNVLGENAPADFIERICNYLVAELREGIPNVFGHGDFWIGNVMYEKASGRITGVFDWGSAASNSPPLEDLFNLLCARKGLLSKYDHGAYLTKLWARRASDQDLGRISGYARSLGLNAGSVGPLSVLFWLRFLATWKDFSDTSWYQRALRGPMKFLAHDRNWNTLGDGII